jgi:hypothetical protein
MLRPDKAKYTHLENALDLSETLNNQLRDSEFL